MSTATSFWPLHKESVSAELVSLFAKLCVSSLVTAAGSDAGSDAHHHLLLHSLTLSYQVMAVWGEVLESVLSLFKDNLTGTYTVTRPYLILLLLFT